MPSKAFDHIEPGMKVARLTVLSKSDKTGKQGAEFWNVRCDCGQELVASDTTLRKVEIRSCGCDDKREDLTGQRFGKLTVLRRTINSPYGKPQFICRCDCGNEKIALVSYLKKFHEPNCGCLTHEQISKARTSHGLEGHPLTPVWRAMMSRCYKPQNKDYKHYGGRGISVCERWHDIKNFVEDMEPGYQPGLQLDRIDNDGPYSPENCRWVTSKQNQRNKRNNRKITTAAGTLPVAQQAEIAKVTQHTIHYRLKQGMPEQFTILPIKGSKRLHPKELGELFDEQEPAIWIDEELEKDINNVIEMSDIQAKVIQETGKGPTSIDIPTRKVIREPNRDVLPDDIAGMRTRVNVKKSDDEIEIRWKTRDGDGTGKPILRNINKVTYKDAQQSEEK